MSKRHLNLPMVLSSLCLFVFAVTTVFADDLPVLKRLDQFFGTAETGTSDRLLLADRDLIMVEFGSSRDVRLGNVYGIYQVNTTIPCDPNGRYLCEKIGELVIVKVFDTSTVGRVTRSFKEILMKVGIIYYLDPVSVVQPEAAVKPPAPPETAAAPAPSVQPEKAPAQARKEVEINPKAEFEQEYIYFAFDDAGLTDDSMRILRKKAEFLKANPKSKTLIEGHCDERGSVEYNLALGDRRACAARDFLVLVGIEADRIQTISYGKERSVDPRHNEEAWAKNRRDQFNLE